MDNWNLRAHLDPDRLLAEIDTADRRARRARTGRPRLDGDALADACELIDSLQGPVDAAATYATVAAMAGDLQTAERLGRAVQDAVGRLEDLAGPWLAMLAGTGQAAFDALVSHPRLRARSASLAAARRGDVAPDPSRHGERVEQAVKPALADLADPDPDVRDAATRAASDRLEQMAETTAAAYHRHVAAALEHGDHDRHVAATGAVPAPLLAAARTVLADRDFPHAATAARADALGRPVGPGDRLVPVGTTACTREQAVAATRTAAGRLGTDAQSAIDRMLAAGTVWIGPDAPAPTCTPVPYAMPMVAVPFDGTVAAGSQVAHELFHGIHACLVAPDVPLAAWRPTTAVAEAAAVLGEWLVADARNPHGTDIAALDLATTVLWRQQAVLDFERAAFERVAAGSTITADWAAQLWRSLVADVHGPAYRHGDGSGDAHWWALFPHLWSVPGYLAAYVAGGLAAATVASRIGGEHGHGEDAAQAWKEVLAAGGTVDTDTALGGLVGAEALTILRRWLPA